MTEMNQIYRCNVCGNMVEIVHPGVGELVCCGQAMELLLERQTDVGPEKHIPVIEKTDKGVKVKIGQVQHPMEENHRIEWIEIMVNGKIYRETLTVEDKPEAEFDLKEDVESIHAREYCSVHGLWPS